METVYAKENLSTEQQTSCEKARFQSTHGDQKRPCGVKTQTSERTQEINSTSLLDLSLPKAERLRKRSEFLHVYNNGERFDGRFITVFILANEMPLHRVGVTATKKGVGKAHDRNRAKRLLREAFRSNKPLIADAGVKYDWVLNARRGMAKVKLAEPLADLKRIMERVVESQKKLTLPQAAEVVEENK